MSSDCFEQESNKSMEEICEQMDHLTMQNLDLMEQKLEANIQLEKLLREGHIEMAKARYICGKESIGMLQVPVDKEQITSLFNLETSFDNPDKKDVACFDISIKKKSGGDENQQDPIKWFGVLVPQSLRNAQKRFQESIYVAVKIANIQAELNALSAELDSLKSLKSATL